jgi:hypothetical protein
MEMDTRTTLNKRICGGPIERSDVGDAEGEKPQGTDKDPLFEKEPQRRRHDGKGSHTLNNMSKPRALPCNHWEDDGYEALKEEDVLPGVDEAPGGDLSEADGEQTTECTAYRGRGDVDACPESEFMATIAINVSPYVSKR